MQADKAIGYALLTALNENGQDLYREIYLKIVGKALTKFSQASDFGKDLDIKELIYNDYGIDIPIFLTRSLVRAFFNSLSKKETIEHSAECFENGASFRITRFSGKGQDLDQKYEDERRKISQLKYDFQSFCRNTYSEEVDTNLLIDFFDKNRQMVLSFFSKEVQLLNDENILSNYSYAANYLNFISRSNDLLYEYASNVFWGSIISAYFESNVEFNANLKLESKVYYLDSPFILNLIDLQLEEETTACRELLDVIQKTGGSVRVLDISLQETTNIIDKTASEYHKLPLTHEVKNDSVSFGAHRRRLTRTQLELVARNLHKTLESDYNIVIESTSPNALKEASSMLETMELEGKRRDIKKSATIDIACINHIRKMRQRSNTYNSIYSASHWLLTTKSGIYKFNVSHSKVSGVPEVILPELLVSYLWLNGGKLKPNLQKVGLTEYVSETIASGLPSYPQLRLINESIANNDQLNEEQKTEVLQLVAEKSSAALQQYVETIAQYDQKQRPELALELYQEVLVRNRNKEEKIRLIGEMLEIERSINQQNELQLTHDQKIMKEMFEAIHGLQSDMTNLTKRNFELEKERETEKLATKKAEDARNMKRKELNDKIYLFLKISGISLVLYLIYFYINANYPGLIYGWIKWLIQLGLFGPGIWSFLSLILNLWKFIRKREYE